MSAPTNVAKTMPVAKLIPSNKEVIDLDTLVQQLGAAKAKNERIALKNRDREAKEG